MAARSIGGTIIKIVVASLLIGLLMKAFDVSPRGLLEALGDTGKAIADMIAWIIEGSMDYILLGAVVVIPIWLVMKLWAVFRGKS